MSLGYVILLNVVPCFILSCFSSNCIFGNLTKSTGKEGTSLAVQWLRLHASTAGYVALIPAKGSKTLHAAHHGKQIN